MRDEADVSRLIGQFDQRAHLLIGQGSNTIFTEDFDGCVSRMLIEGVEISESDADYILRVGAGEDWHQLVSQCVKSGIHGLENLALIPGTVGAAPIQNIGAYGREVCDFIDYVECISSQTNEQFRLSRDECNFGYRDSVFKQGMADKCVITRVGFRIPKHWQAAAEYGELKKLSNPSADDIFNQVINIRRAKLPDPAQTGNAGSFFKNPVIDSQTFDSIAKNYPDAPHYPASGQKVKVPAAWLIDQLGFKGKVVGDIQCHPKQALVLTNTGNGTGKDVLQMARDIMQAVSEHFGISLENEVRLIGREGLISL